MDSGMDQNFKRRWVEALRSGKYVQGKNYLLRNGRHCCLGVACELLVEEKKLVKEEDVVSETFCFRPAAGGSWRHSTIPRSSLSSIGLDDATESKLMDMNDSQGKSFSEIADYIETL